MSFESRFLLDGFGASEVESQVDVDDHDLLEEEYSLRTEYD